VFVYKRLHFLPPKVTYFFNENAISFILQVVYFLQVIYFGKQLPFDLFQFLQVVYFLQVDPPQPVGALVLQKIKRNCETQGTRTCKWDYIC